MVNLSRHLELSSRECIKKKVIISLLQDLKNLKKIKEKVKNLKSLLMKKWINLGKSEAW